MQVDVPSRCLVEDSYITVNEMVASRRWGKGRTDVHDCVMRLLEWKGSCECHVHSLRARFDECLRDKGFKIIASAVATVS